MESVKGASRPAASLQSEGTWHEGQSLGTNSTTVQGKAKAWLWEAHRHQRMEAQRRRAAAEQRGPMDWEGHDAGSEVLRDDGAWSGGAGGRPWWRSN